MIKKGWDEIYRGPKGAEGFLSRAQEARAGWQEGHKQAKRKARDQALKDYIAKHDTLAIDLIWTKTTQRTTLKKMSSEGWKRQLRQWNLHFIQGMFGLYHDLNLLQGRTNRLRAGLEDWLNSTLTPVLEEYEILSDGTEATAAAKPRVELLSGWRVDAILLCRNAC